jgi:uncharacterized protein (DUF1800 family)
MVRSDQQLIERMILIWHSWFATSEEASSARLMINQNWMMRRHALGNFHQLLRDLTVDPAMLLWLNGNTNYKGSPNENYAREMLELFTLGADHAYDQEDVHQNARALTGWTNDWDQEQGPVNFRFEPKLHDFGIKRIFGHRGRFDWRDSCRLAVSHPDHPTFLVRKLWGYFVGADIPNGTARALRRAYVDSGQVLFQPPNVSGWNHVQWLDTSRWAGRLEAVDMALQKHVLSGKTYPYGIAENAKQAYEHAIRFWGGRPLSDTARNNLVARGRRIAYGQTQPWEQVVFRQRARTRSGA